MSNLFETVYVPSFQLPRFGTGHVLFHFGKPFPVFIGISGIIYIDFGPSRPLPGLPLAAVRSLEFHSKSSFQIPHAQAAETP